MNHNKELIGQIAQAPVEEIGDILQAAMERYRSLFPEEEILYLALPKNDPRERQRLLQTIQPLLK